MASTPLLLALALIAVLANITALERIYSVYKVAREFRSTKRCPWLMSVNRKDDRGMSDNKKKAGPKPLHQVRPEPTRIAPAEGKLGVLLAGLGAVATTFIAGVEAVRRGRRARSDP